MISKIVSVKVVGEMDEIELSKMMKSLKKNLLRKISCIRRCFGK